ncbi:MAG: SMC-Scp complex subunit ScpB, partial [Terracidiphilus sp.]
AEQEAAAAAAKEAEPAQAATSQAMLGEGLEYLGLEQTPAFYTSEESAPEGTETALEPALELELEPAFDAAADAAEPSAEPDAEPETVAAEAKINLDAETEAKRQAKLRDREAKGILRRLLDELIQSYAADARGIEIREIAGGYRMATKPECHDAVRLFIKSLKPAMKLSLPALETLAVIAYKQPVTAPEVNEIRGVESAGVLGSLLSRKLITTAGRKQVIGRPILYKTTKEFLLRFGLKDVSELPSMEEFEKIAAIELSEPEGEPDSEDSGAGRQPGGPDAAEFDENAPEPEDGELAETAAGDAGSGHARSDEAGSDEAASDEAASDSTTGPPSHERAPAEPETAAE